MVGGDIQSYRDLRVWQKAIALSIACYELTKEFPKDEMYGMTSQVRRSSVSVAANIAERHGRENTKMFVHFLRIAQGSVKELETHLILASEVGLATKQSTDPLLTATDEVGRMLRSFDQVTSIETGGG